MTTYPNRECFHSECYNQRGCDHPRVAFRRRSSAAGPVECYGRDQSGTTILSAIQPNLHFLVLDLSLDIVGDIEGLDLEHDGLAGDGLREDLHATTKAKGYARTSQLRVRRNARGSHLPRWRVLSF
jgi:hypothetical protein